MFLALVAAAVLETPPSPAVELTRSGLPGTPVAASPRTLSDVAREMRDGRRATGGFSAVESTVPRTAFDPWLLRVAVEEERRREEPEPVPEGEAAGYASNEIYGWGGGWWGPPPRRRPPHVSHRGPNGVGRRREGGGGRSGGGDVRPPVRAGASTSSYSSRFPLSERKSSSSR